MAPCSIGFGPRVSGGELGSVRGATRRASGPLPKTGAERPESHCSLQQAAAATVEAWYARHSPGERRCFLTAPRGIGFRQNATVEQRRVV